MLTSCESVGAGSGVTEDDLKMQLRILTEDYFRTKQEIRDLVIMLSLPDFMSR